MDPDKGRSLQHRRCDTGRRTVLALLDRQIQHVADKRLARWTDHNRLLETMKLLQVSE